MSNNPLLEEEDYRALVTGLQWAEGFGLFFVVCTPMQAEILIKQVKADISYQKVQALSLSEPIDNIYSALEDPSYHQADIVFIEGIEKSLVADIQPGKGGRGGYYKQDSVPRILGHLNLQRERFRETFATVRFVFLLPKFALNYFMLRAPDFFDWRSGLFEFSMEKTLLAQASLSLLQELPPDYEKLTSTERKEKIFELQTLIEEPHQSQDNTIKLYHRYIDLLFADEQLEVVAESCESLLRMAPKDVRALGKYAVTLSYLGRYEKALGKLDEAFAHMQSPDNEHQFLTLRTFILFNLNRKEEALQALDKLEKFDKRVKKISAYLAFRGSILLGMECYEKALASFNKAMKLDHDINVWEQHGDALLHLKRYKKAIVSFDRALEKNQDNHQIWLKKGFAFENIEQYEVAATCYQTVIEHIPNDASACFFKGNALASLKQYEEALTYYDKAIQYNPNEPAFWDARSDVLSELGRYEEAVTSYEKVAKASDDEFAAWGTKIIYHIENVKNNIIDLKRINIIIIFSKKQIELREDYFEPYYNIGICYIILKEYKIALENFTHVLELKPENYTILANRAGALSKLNRFQEALTDLDRLTEKAPNFLLGWEEKIALLFELKRYDDVVSSCNKAMSAGHHVAGIMVSLAKAYLKLDRYQDAMNACKKAIKLKPNDAQAWLTQADAFAYLNKKVKMLYSLKKVICYHPDKLDAWRQHGILLVTHKYLSDALVSFKHGIDLNQADCLIWMCHGFALFSLQKYSDARISFEKSIALFPEAVPSNAKAGFFFYYASCLLELSEYEKSLQTIDLAITARPKDASYLYCKACIYSRWEKPEPAVLALEQVVNLDQSYFEQLKSDEDLDNLRDHPGFQAILQKQPEETKQQNTKQSEKLRNKLSFGEDHMNPASAFASSLSLMGEQPGFSLDLDLNR